MPSLQAWARRQAAHEVSIVHSKAKLESGDLLFLISCGEIVGADVRDRFRHTLVVHASALPEGRGWSPHVWQVVEGAKRIPVTLLSAGDSVDTGDIWTVGHFDLEGHELFDEINGRLFDVTAQLLDFAVAHADAPDAAPQPHTKGRVYRKRSPEDSRVDPNKTIAEQFDLLRVADPERFPNFFDHRGHRYLISVRKAKESK